MLSLLPLMGFVYLMDFFFSFGHDEKPAFVSIFVCELKITQLELGTYSILVLCRG